MKNLSPMLVIALVLAISCSTDRVFAASVQTIANPVPNGYIKLDGNINDWLALSAYDADAVGDGSTGPARPLDIDILQGAVAHDDNNFYFLYRNAGDNMVDPASNWIFIDLDQNKATGYSGTPELSSIGMEFNLGGTVGWNEWNADGSYAGIAAGRSVAVGDSDASGGADFLEWSVSRSAIQPSGGTFNPTGTSFDLIFGAEDTTFDTSPDNGNVDWFTYDASGTYNPGAPGDADGNGIINMDDYLLIQSHSFTVQKLGTQGDVNDDGFVDFGDFQQWKANFPGGVAAADAAIASIPEPASATLSLCGVLCLLGSRRRNREV